MPKQETPYEVLSKLFSDEGYSHGAFSVKIENTITIRVYKDGTNLPTKGGATDYSHVTDSIGYLIEYLYPVNKSQLFETKLTGV